MTTLLFDWGVEQQVSQYIKFIMPVVSPPKKKKKKKKH